MMIKKRALRIARVLYGAVQWTLILFALALAGLFLFGIRPYIVQTGSMEPTIETGSLCFVNHRAAFEEVAAGDVIAFRSGEMMVTHRAIRRTEAGIITQGDANQIADSAAVTSENFVGETVFWLPKAGILIAQFKSWRGLTCILLGTACFILLGVILEDHSNKPKTEPPHSEEKDG